MGKGRGCAGLWVLPVRTRWGGFVNGAGFDAALVGPLAGEGVILNTRRLCCNCTFSAEYGPIGGDWGLKSAKRTPTICPS